MLKNSLEIMFINIRFLKIYFINCSLKYENCSHEVQNKASLKK